MAPRKKKADAEVSDLTGPDLVDIMANEPTLDRYFDQNPANLTDDDLWELIGIQRAERAMYIKKGE